MDLTRSEQGWERVLTVQHTLQRSYTSAIENNTIARGSVGTMHPCRYADKKMKGNNDFFRGSSPERFRSLSTETKASPRTALASATHYAAYWSVYQTFPRPLFGILLYKYLALKTLQCFPFFVGLLKIVACFIQVRVWGNSETITMSSLSISYHKMFLVRFQEVRVIERAAFQSAALTAIQERGSGKAYAFFELVAAKNVRTEPVILPFCCLCHKCANSFNRK